MSTDQTKITEADVEELMRATAYVAAVITRKFAEAHPKSSKWTDTWCELRQIIGFTFPEDRQHQSILVVVQQNRKTHRVTERVMFVGTGDCPVCTAMDLLTQLRAEVIPGGSLVDSRAPAPSPRGLELRVAPSCFPTTMFGHNRVTGLA